MHQELLCEHYLYSTTLGTVLNAKLEQVENRHRLQNLTPFFAGCRRAAGTVLLATLIWS